MFVLGIIALAIVAMLALIAVLRRIAPTSTKTIIACLSPKPLDPGSFNKAFVAANTALTRGDAEALKTGLSLLIDSLAVSGGFTTRVIDAISELRCALSHHDRADTKGPWNRDLSGYGVVSWKNDLYDRDDALRRAWKPISSINNELRAQGLGWQY